MENIIDVNKARPLKAKATVPRPKSICNAKSYNKR